MSRIILHIDMNSYFASAEQQANPFLRGKPIGVTGKRTERSVVAAASREAKRLGVATAMSTRKAKRVLPSLILVMGDPEKYGDLTRRFNAVFHEFTDRVEQFSVDESFLDVTDTARDFLGATMMAQAIRVRLLETCGERVTASIGIASNKPMAKLASERVKPNGLTVVLPGRERELIDASALEDVCGIGPRVAARLEALGIRSFAQLRAYPIRPLAREFKSFGLWLHEIAHGRGNDMVVAEDPDPKSVGHSYTLPHDTEDPAELKRYLLALCDKVAWRLRRDGFVARRIAAYLRFSDFSGNGRQVLFHEPLNDGLAIFRAAWSIAGRLLDAPVRLVGVSASALARSSAPASLFKKERKMSSALLALDAIQTRYGDHAWTRASLLRTRVMERTSGFRYDHEL